MEHDQRDRDFRLPALWVQEAEAQPAAPVENMIEQNPHRNKGAPRMGRILT